MKLCRYLLTFILLISFHAVVFSQDTLPKFSVKNVGNNRYIIGWVNQFQKLKQISIQRSHDSLKNYKTILSVTDPNAVQNGFADTKAPNDHMYYRLFYVLEGGEYFFTEAKQPVIDTTAITTQQVVPIDVSKDNGTRKPDAFVPSFYVYTNKEGYVFINLPDADKKNYRLKFFEEDDSFLFEIKNIEEPALTLDKANFFHAGWFKFELYNNDKLVEKHKFYLKGF